jgi:plasmid stabilization system protein ParE
MQHFSVALSPRARAEIIQIATYLSEHSLPAAERFLRDIEKLQDRLGQFPQSGTLGLIPGVRRIVVGDYLVSYRLRENTVQIFAIRHGRRSDARF